MKVKLFFCGYDPNFNRPLFGGLAKAPNEQQYRVWTDTPLGIGYLKSNCETKDISVEIVHDRSELKDCDLIGLSSTSMALREAIDILEKTQIPIVIGGYSSYWDGLQKYPFKHIVKGDGEHALQDIIAGKSLTQFIQKPVKDLDSLKFPYRGNCLKHIRATSSRGCNFRCNFCSVPMGGVRYHSAEWFIDDITQAQRALPHIHYLDIQDELFARSEKRVEEIYRLWSQRNLSAVYHDGIFRARADQLTPPVIKLLMKMNLRTVQMGIESASNRVLELMNKGITIEESQRALTDCLKAGMRVKGNFIVNSPGETYADRKLTLKFITKNTHPLFEVEVTPFKPFPGSTWWQDHDPLQALDSQYFTTDLLQITYY